MTYVRYQFIHPSALHCTALTCRRMISLEQYRARVGGFHRKQRAPPCRLSSSYATLEVPDLRHLMKVAGTRGGRGRGGCTTLASLARALKMQTGHLVPTMAILLTACYLQHNFTMPAPALEDIYTSSHQIPCTSTGCPDPASRPGGRHLASLFLLLIIAGIESNPGPDGKHSLCEC